MTWTLAKSSSKVESPDAAAAPVTASCNSLRLHAEAYLQLPWLASDLAAAEVPSYPEPYDPYSVGPH